MSHEEFILVLDFGSQYTQLIARRIRELGVYSEIRAYDISPEEVNHLRPQGIILSGGPSSVFQKDAPIINRKILQLKIPILGICYGLQLLAFLLNGEVAKATNREYGFAELVIEQEDDLFKGIENRLKVWMSHGDRLTKIPEDFEVIAKTSNSPIAVVRNSAKKIYGLQFHPEVVHTQKGMDILGNFIFNVCNCTRSWSPGSFIDSTIDTIRNTVGSKRVLCALSGGVDSSVAAVLVERAIKDQLVCVFVDTGLLRNGEAVEVCDTFSSNHFAFEFCFVDASARFLDKLRNVQDPEVKRKIIGNEFIHVFEEEAKKVGDIEYLVQGTLYPDVIESVSVRGPSATIKTHHNVGGLPEKMGLKLIEPLRELFKDEVRSVGRELDLPEHILTRHPFPGPGLAVRIMGEVNAESLAILRQADQIFIEELHNSDWYNKVWQAFCVFLPVKSVGVMGDERTYESVIAIRAVTSTDGMTADWARLPHELLVSISTRISNEVAGINRVVFDISSKPPSTIEWE